MLGVHRVPTEYKNTVWGEFLKNNIVILMNESFSVRFKKVDDVKSKIDLEEPIFIELQKSFREKRKKLFCVFSGGVTVDSSGKTLISYVTRVSYFEQHPVHASAVTHLYSCHYDMDGRKILGHPLFHMQMSALPAEHKEAVETLFSEVECENNNNCKLSHLRHPTPQMDMFRFILQLLADHFLDGDGVDEHGDDFRKLASCLYGAEYLPRADVKDMLDKVNASERLCSLAWYEV